MQTFLPKNEGLLCVVRQYTHKTLHTLFYGSQRQHSMFAIKLKLHIYRNKTKKKKREALTPTSSNKLATQASPEPLCVPLSPSSSEACCSFTVRCVRVRAYDSCRSKCLWLHRSKLLCRGWCAFPCYICKGRSYTYFLLQIKDNMLKRRLRLVFLWQPVVSHAFEWKRDFSLQSLPSYAECTLPMSCSNNVSIQFNETPKSRKKIF